ncbi:Levodione reductase [compost metagenome]
MGDVSDDAVIAQIVEVGEGRITGLVNNAGIMDAFVPTAEIDDALWERVLRINVTAPMKLMRAVLPAMVEAGHGRIVNVASEAIIRAGASGTPYATSKHAVVGLTKSTALFYGPAGVRVNAVAPGAVATNIEAPFRSELGAQRLGPIMQATVPAPATAEQLAASITWLLSEDSANVNGALLSRTAAGRRSDGTPSRGADRSATGRLGRADRSRSGSAPVPTHWSGSDEVSPQDRALGVGVAQLLVEPQDGGVGRADHEPHLAGTGCHEPRLGRHDGIPAESRAPERGRHRHVVDPAAVPLVAGQRRRDDGPALAVRDQDGGRRVGPRVRDVPVGVVPRAHQTALVPQGDDLLDVVVGDLTEVHAADPQVLGRGVGRTRGEGVRESDPVADAARSHQRGWYGETTTSTRWNSLRSE